MAPVPKKKHTRSRSGKRRHSPSNRGVLPNLVKCPACGELKPTHQACPHCGAYNTK